MYEYLQQDLHLIVNLMKIYKYFISLMQLNDDSIKYYEF